jgi:hypothetical protein
MPLPHLKVFFRHKRAFFMGNALVVGVVEKIGVSTKQNK